MSEANPKRQMVDALQHAGTLRRPEEFIHRIPVKISIKGFRKRLRECGIGFQYRRQLMITEEDFQAFLQRHRVEQPKKGNKKCRSSSSATAKSGTSEVVLADDAYAKALELINAR